MAGDDELVTHVVAAGIAVLGDLGIERDRVAGLVRDLRADAVSVDAVTERAAEVYLAAGCLANGRAALAALDRIYIARVPDVIANKSLPPDAVDEVCQTVRQRLLVGQPPYLAGAIARGSLAGLVAVIATRAAIDRLRAIRRDDAAHAGEPEGDDLVATGDPARDHLRARYRAEVKAAFEAAANELPPRDRTLLRLYLVDRLTIDDIAELYQLHRATAARQIDRAREKVATATRKALARMSGLGGEDLHELGALVTSQLDLSLSRVLASR